MLVNILIFAGVFGIGCLLAFGGGGERRKMKQRIERMKTRKVSVPKSMQDVSLRRKTNEAKGMVYWLMKPLPDFKRLGDRLERAGKTISPKQYVFRRAVTLIIIMFVISGVFH